MIKLVIFDFDGTIVDSKSAYYTAITHHLESLGFNKKEIIEVIDLGMSLSETLKKFLPSKFYRWWIRRKIMKDVLKEAHNVRKCHDSSHIKDIKIRKILISNSLSEFVYPILNHFKMRRLFKQIYCADDFDDKAIFIRDYLKTNRIRPDECFYIGDRAADSLVARKVKCHSIIVSGKCAWNSKDEIIKSKPDFIVPSLMSVKTIIERFKS